LYERRKNSTKKQINKQINKQSILPLLINLLALLPYLLVAGLDQAGIRDVAEILHIVFAIWNPPYG